MKITLEVNGQHREVDTPPLARLIDVLRDQLQLTGTKEGCGEGECGSCTVLLDGDPVNACLVPIGQCMHRRVVTVEGVVDERELSPLALSLIRSGGVQCGICTPGVMVSTHALLLRTPRPTEQQIREGIAGNICRCTGYRAIIQAVRDVVEQGEAPE